MEGAEKVKTKTDNLKSANSPNEIPPTRRTKIRQLAERNHANSPNFQKNVVYLHSEKVKNHGFIQA